MDKLKLNPKDLESVVCESCGNDTFVESYFLKRVSALISPDGQEKFVPLPTFKCSSCGNINATFRPENMKV